MHDNGEAIVVEIDETKFFHRKYHRRQWQEDQCVFGKIERESGKCFPIEVPIPNAITARHSHYIGRLDNMRKHPTDSARDLRTFCGYTCTIAISLMQTMPVYIHITLRILVCMQKES